MCETSWSTWYSLSLTSAVQDQACSSFSLDCSSVWSHISCSTCPETQCDFNITVYFLVTRLLSQSLSTNTLTNVELSRGNQCVRSHFFDQERNTCSRWCWAVQMHGIFWAVFVSDWAPKKQFSHPSYWLLQEGADINCNFTSSNTTSMDPSSVAVEKWYRFQIFQVSICTK